MQFTPSPHLTIGAEVELQLLDAHTLDLKPCSIEVLEQTNGCEYIKPEIFQSLIEINSGICTNVHQLEKDFESTIPILQSACKNLGVLLSATGTHPFAQYNERILYPSERFNYLIDRNQWIARRLMIFGLHVHIGMRDAPTCIEFFNLFLFFLPHLLALSASSPFWQGTDTGLASCRTTIFESSPASGHPYPVRSWDEFRSLCQTLSDCRAIQSHKDLWWDIRPSPEFGTLEIRICDGVATMREMYGIVAFIHALCHWYENRRDVASSLLPGTLPEWMVRENKWRATRHGLNAELIVSPEGKLVPMRENVINWLEILNDTSLELDYLRYFKPIHNILASGNSADRQRALFLDRNNLEDVVRFNVAEFNDGIILPS